jgi:DNA polymerase III subunit epsilon
MILFFDTETTGLPNDWEAPVTDLENWPRLVQLAYLCCDYEGNKIKEGNILIKPEDFIIPYEGTRIHGITTEKAINEGKDLKTVLEEFKDIIEEADLVVAHNIDYDEKIIGAELLRKNFKNIITNKRKICTMKSATDFCAIENSYGYKWPSLEELHLKLFNLKFEGAHDAFYDIQATAKCFWELNKRGVIKWEKQKNDLATEILCVAVSDSGKDIIIGGDEGIIYFWDNEELKLRKIQKLGNNNIVALGFNKESTLLAIGNSIGEIFVWDLLEEVIKYSFTIPFKLGECGTIGTDNVFQFTSFGLVITPKKFNCGVVIFHFGLNRIFDTFNISLNGNATAISSENYLFLLDLNEGALSVINEPFYSTYSERREKLNILNEDEDSIFLQILDTSDDTIVETYLSYENLINLIKKGKIKKAWNHLGDFLGFFPNAGFISLSNDGSIIAIENNGGYGNHYREVKIEVFKFTNSLFNKIGEINAHTCYIFSLKFSADNSKLISASADGTIKIWDLKTFLCIKHIEHNVGIGNLVEFNSIGDKFITINKENKMTIFDLNRSELFEIKLFKDGNYLLTKDKTDNTQT